MARFGGLVVSALLALAAVLLLVGPAGATHDHKHSAAGNWRMHFPKTPGRADTGVLHLRAVDKAAASAAAAQLQWGSWALGGTGCGPRATEFAVGTFERDSDNGPVVGCFSPTSGIFYGVFKSTKYKVEGGLSGSLSGPMNSGVFPSQPNNSLATTFIGHFAGDGAKAEEALAGSLCPAARRTSSRGQTPPQAACALDRVVFIEGTNKPVLAKSERAAVRQPVYLLARVTSKVVPADVVLVFPPAVKEVDIFAKPEASVGVTCGKPAATGEGRQYLLCKLTQANARVAVGVYVPTALGGKELKVELLVGRPRASRQAAREWLANTAKAVDVELEVVAPPPPPPPPPPGANKNSLEGHWVEFVPTGAKTRTRFGPAFPGADLRIAISDKKATRAEVFATSSGNVDLILLDPQAAGRPYYDGSASFPPSASASALKPITLELIAAGKAATRFPGVCGGIAVQANAPILCGTWGKDTAERRVVLRRVSD